MTGTFYDNKGGNPLDQFSIEKEIKNTEADIQPVSLSTSNVSPASQNSNTSRDYLPSCNYCDK